MYCTSRRFLRGKLGGCLAKKKTRVLYITGEINFESYKEFSEALLEAETDKCTHIRIELASDGGDAHAALAFSARMKHSQAEITIIAMGNVASAAVLILASGDHRVMTSEAWVMVHEEQCELTGNVSDLERETRQLRILEDQWAALLEKYTDRNSMFWAAAHKKTTYLGAADCKHFGLVDEVI